MTTDARQRLRLIVAFAIVYIVWGSTFFAIRVGVQDIPPFLLAGARNTSAGLALMLVAMASGQLPPWRSPDWSTALPVGILMITIANGLTTLSEVWVPSNQAALISVSSALWTAWFGTFGARGHRLSPRSRLGLAIGFAGAVLLLMPGEGFSFQHLGAQSLILIATLSWAAGAMYGRARAPVTPPLMLAAMQMFVGGVAMLLIAAVSSGGDHWHWTSRGVAAVAYLAVFGSCLSYTTYIWLIRHVTPDKLSTISYMNPLVAVVLGWVGLGETLEWTQVTGMVVIFTGVVLINTRPNILSRLLKAT